MTARRPQSRGMCRACGFTGTKVAMTRHHDTCSQRPLHRVKARDGYRLRVTANSRYWLDVEVPVSATLDDLDGFLRGIWLECCGHLSEFSIGPQEDHDDFDPFRPRRKRKQPTLEELGLGAGDRFDYTYDFGSSTNLKLTVQAREPVTTTARNTVRLLARNLPPELSCQECGAPARWAHSWEYDDLTGQPTMYCDRHGEQTREEQLPVVNSPRMGVCAYEGGNDDDWPPAEAPEPAGKAPAQQKAPAQKNSAQKPPVEEPGAPETTPKKARASGTGTPAKGRPDRDGSRVSVDPDTGDALIRIDSPRVAAFFDAAFKDEAFDLDPLRALPLDPNLVWIVTSRELPGLLPPEEVLPSVTLILNAVTGQILATELIPDATPDDVLDVVLDAMLDGAGGPARPRLIITPDAALAPVLADILTDLDIQVNQQAMPEIDEMFAEMTAQISTGLMDEQAAYAPRAFLTDADDATVRAFQQAGARFMAAAPWQTFPPNRLLRASWTAPDGTPAQLYALVMGELGQEYGLALYPDWLSYVQHTINSFNSDLALLVTGGLESLTMSTEAEFDPQDWARLRAAGLGARTRQAPSLTRFTATGTAQPRTPLHAVIALLNAVSERAERRRTTVTSMKTELDGVQIQFPAGPRDDLSPAEQEGSVRVVVRSGGAFVSSRPVILTGPPDMLLSRAFSAARKVLQEKERSLNKRFHLPYYLESPDILIEDGGMFGDLHGRMWESHVSAPHLTLAHLVRLGTLMDGLGTVQATRQPGVVDDLTLELGSEEDGLPMPPPPNLRLR
ncbi:plasmid pRiA4b ORF-3 family protein [Deinococcus knuensis]|nr:plasmid pRiA4b ORF-3 family protein [Deinococcus knuensis]